MRLRRLRENEALREMLSEHRLHPKELIQPLFVKEGLKQDAAIESMPGQAQLTLSSAVQKAQRLEASGGMFL